MAKGADYIGWTVRVLMEDEVIMMYAVGLPNHLDAEKAVADKRHTKGEQYEAIDPITENHGPAIEPGEVRAV